MEVRITMRVLILANNDVGLYKFRKELIEELIHPGSYIAGRKAKPCKVYVSLPDGEFVPELKKLGCKYLNTPIDRRGVNPVTDLKLLVKYRELLRKIKPNIVLGYTIKPNIYGGLICRVLHVPYIANITGLGTAYQRNTLLKQLVNIMYKVALKEAKIIFFENNENRDVLLRNKISRKERTYVLAGAGVNLEYFHYSAYPEDSEVTHFLFIGRVMQEKGINELLYAIKRLIQEGYLCILDIVGATEENYSGVIKDFEKKGWINYYGFQKDVRPFIEKCHCFVLPSWHEGMANVNLESAAMGRPVITSRIHGCMEAVKNGESGFLFESKNATDLYNVMRKFIEQPYERKKRFGKMGRKHMEEIFDKRKVVKETIIRIEELFK